MRLPVRYIWCKAKPMVHPKLTPELVNKAQPSPAQLMVMSVSLASCNSSQRSQALPLTLDAPLPYTPQHHFCPPISPSQTLAPPLPRPPPPRTHLYVPSDSSKRSPNHTPPGLVARFARRCTSWNDSARVASSLTTRAMGLSMATGPHWKWAAPLGRLRGCRRWGEGRGLSVGCTVRGAKVQTRWPGPLPKAAVRMFQGS